MSLLVGLKLLEGGIGVGSLVGSVLEFDDGQGQAVDKEDDVGSAGVLQRRIGASDRPLLADAELVDGQVVVIFAAPIHDLRRLVDGAPVLALVADRYAIHQQAVQAVVVLEQVGGVSAGELAKGVVQGHRRQVGIEPGQSRAQAVAENDIVISAAFGRDAIGREVGAADVGIAHLAQPVQGGEFDVGFGEAIGHGIRPGLLLSVAQRAGLSWMYWRMRCNASSSRTMCS